MQITAEKLTAVGIKGANEWAPLIQNAVDKYEINTRLRVCAFIAQCAHESAGFSRLVENLNYSADGLVKVFPKYFPDSNIAWRYARQPLHIASRVYANRMGNGSEDTTDGYLFRGRGLIQVTGRESYRKCSMFLFGDDRLEHFPELLEIKENALASACWYWVSNKLNVYADNQDFVTLTKRINGGTNGLADRKKYYEKCLTVFV